MDSNERLYEYIKEGEKIGLQYGLLSETIRELDEKNKLEEFKDIVYKGNDLSYIR